jgi:hypothetical protein
LGDKKLVENGEDEWGMESAGEIGVTQLEGRPFQELK